ncbi:MAG TPA: Bcr/CflA family efflux MFS transporter [Marinospirillum sp.]|uniref:Bcr/CflA family efflux MFS transporter n=1 Tax=Marinospirillum sp. TaxID=2183934 RepID=UPI002B493BF1|nr:Bcr/CflA family efflux MFS transporter [Marinospirillum sp.]HKM16574.1 Bcr/CflA family efflux MFS transporter [Marinospirillum sp.]
MKQAPPLTLLVFIAMASPMALNAFVPAMPDAAMALQTDIATMQLTFTLYLLTLAIGQLLSGQLADYYGRRPVLLIGFAIHLAGSFLAAMAGSIEVLIAGRVLQALGGSTAMTLARTVLLDTYGKTGAASRMGYLVMAIAVAQAIAPAIGGFLNLWSGWNAIFYLSVFMGSLVFLLALKFLPETTSEKSTSLSFMAVVKRYSQVFSSGQYLGYVLSTTALAAAFYLFVGSSPYLVINQLGGNSADFGVWFLSVSFSFIVGGYLSTRLAQFISIDQTIFLGNGLAILGASLLLGLALTAELSFTHLFLPMMVIIFGRGLSQPNAQLAAISSTSGSSGTASGVMGFIQLFIGAMIAQSVPYLLDFNINWVFGGILLATCLAFFAHFYSWKINQNATPSVE